MKRTITFFILFLAWLFHANAGVYTIASYKIRADLDMNTRRLNCNVTLAICKADTARTFLFLFSRDARITEISADGLPGISYRFSGRDSLILTLKSGQAESKKTAIRFTYSLPLDSFMVKRGMVVMKRSERWYPLQMGVLFQARLSISVPQDLVTVSNGECLKQKQSGNRVQHDWETSHACNIALFVFNPDSMEYK